MAGTGASLLAPRALEGAWDEYHRRAEHVLLSAAHRFEADEARLWNLLRFRVTSLTEEMTTAAENLLREAQEAGEPTRAKALRAFARLAELDRERERIQEAIWQLLAEARATSLAHRRELHQALGRLPLAGEWTVQAAEEAMRAAANGGVKVGDTEIGAKLLDEVRSAIACTRREMERYLRRIEGHLEEELAVRRPNWERAAAHFAQRMAGWLGAEGTGAPRPLWAALPRQALAAAARKRAPIPQFLLRRLYRKGSLCSTAQGVEMSFANSIGFCIIVAGDPILVDGRPFPREETVLDNGEQQVRGSALSEEQRLKFFKDGTLRVTLRGLRLEPGPHRLRFSVQLRKLGWIDLDVHDTLRNR